MTPPLTRETLAEIRRLHDAAFDAFRSWLDACDGLMEGAAWDRFAEADEARNGVVRAYLDSLLAAAERGLDVEGGR